MRPGKKSASKLDALQTLRAFEALAGDGAQRLECVRLAGAFLSTRATVGSLARFRHRPRVLKILLTWAAPVVQGFNPFGIAHPESKKTMLFIAGLE